MCSLFGARAFLRLSWDGIDRCASLWCEGILVAVLLQLIVAAICFPFRRVRNHCMSIVGRECRPLLAMSVGAQSLLDFCFVDNSVCSLPFCGRSSHSKRLSLSHCHYHCECHPHYHCHYHCHCLTVMVHHDDHTEGFAPIWIDLEHGPAFLVAQEKCAKAVKSAQNMKDLSTGRNAIRRQAKGNMRLFCWASIYALSTSQVIIETARSQRNWWPRPGLCLLADSLVWKDCLQLPSTGPKPT